MRDFAKIFDALSYDQAELEQIAALVGFDSAYYLATYDDIARAGVDPLRHFLSQGVNEGRVPMGPTSTGGEEGLEAALGFDPTFYIASYPDVTGNPSEHFFAAGLREQRLPFDLMENLAAERLVARVLEKARIAPAKTLETQARFDAQAWAPVATELMHSARRMRMTPKRYRNNFWLAAAIGLLASGQFGAATCCYNFYFNYYTPMAWLGNGGSGLFGAGRITAAAAAIEQEGAGVAWPKVAADVMVPDPVFLNRANPGHQVIRAALPRPVYGILSDVQVVGGSSLMLRAGHDVLYDYAEAGLRPPELQCPSILHVVGDYCSFRIPAETIELDEAFSLLHDHGHNYHHWLLEVLPRYLLARREGLSEDVPLLVEGHIAPQMRQILREIFQFDPPVVTVARGTSARVRRLHFVSDLCVNRVYTESIPAREDILFSPTAIELLRGVAASHFVDTPGRHQNVLIVRRNVEFRRLINRGVLQIALKEKGFWNFDPGGASWIDQVRVFSNARLIVAEAGAALANLVFCRAGATVIVLVSGHKNSNFYYLSQLAALVGVRLFFFECRRLEGSHQISVQDDMVVPVRPLSEWIERFLADPTLIPFQDLEDAAIPDKTPRRRAARRKTEATL